MEDFKKQAQKSKLEQFEEEEAQREHRKKLDEEREARLRGKKGEGSKESEKKVRTQLHVVFIHSFHNIHSHCSLWPEAKEEQEGAEGEGEGEEEAEEPEQEEVQTARGGGGSLRGILLLRGDPARWRWRKR